MYRGCLMRFVCFISHVIHHCNVFSPWILKYSPWTLTACRWLWGCSASPLLPACQTSTKLEALANGLTLMFSEGRCHQTLGVCLTKHFCCAHQHHKIFWAGRDHRDHGVQFLSTPDLQILENPRAGHWTAAVQCVQPALHLTKPWLTCAKPRHKT